MTKSEIPDPHTISDHRLPARKSKALERAFETVIPPAVYDAMEAELGGAYGQ